MIVLKIIGWVLLSILALIVLALFIRVRFRIEYSSENTSVLLRWLFLKIPLYPTEKKEKKPKEETPEEEKPEEKKEEKQKEKKEGDSFLSTLYQSHGIGGIVELLKKVLGYTKTLTSNLIHSLVIDELFLDIACAKADAAETAIYYGEVCSVLFPLLGSLASRCRMKKYNVNIYPDFLAKMSDASFVVSLHLTPAYLIGVLVAYVCKLIFGVLIKMLVKISGVKKEKKTDRNDNNSSEEKSEVK